MLTMKLKTILIVKYLKYSNKNSTEKNNKLIFELYQHT